MKERVKSAEKISLTNAKPSLIRVLERILARTQRYKKELKGG